MGTHPGHTKGNQFWKQRTKYGVQSIMRSPEQLFEACNEYFEWVEQNPLVEEKVGFSKGRVLRTDVQHPRAMTIVALSLFLGIIPETWRNWRKDRDDLKPVIHWAEGVIRSQKFENAAAGLLNANIISRELGLADRQVMDVSAPRMVISPPAGEALPPPPIYGDGDDDE